MKTKAPTAEELLQSLRARVSGLEPGFDRLKLEIGVQTLSQKLEEKKTSPWLEWVKVIGTIAVSLGAVWTIYQGIAEYGRTLAQRNREPFITAISAFANSTSAADRAAALVTVDEYLNRPEYKASGANGASSVRERTLLALTFRSIEEPSLPLRAAIVGMLSEDKESAKIGITMLAISNVGLTDELRINKLQPNADAKEQYRISTQLRASAWAIGRLLQESGFGRDGGDVGSALDLSKWLGESSVRMTLGGAYLANVNFGLTDLSGADFSGSNIADADLTMATLDEHALKSICRADNRKTAHFKREDERELLLVCDNMRSFTPNDGPRLAPALRSKSGDSRP